MVGNTSTASFAAIGSANSAQSASAADSGCTPWRFMTSLQLSATRRSSFTIRRGKDEISRHTASSTYFARMQLGRLIDSALEEIGHRYVNDIHDQIKPVAVASRSNKPIGDRMILNAAFLVDRAQEQAFDERVKETSRKYEELLTFKYSGPWPPYNFVNIKLKLEKAD